MRAGSCPRVHSLPAAACSKAPRHACSGRTAIIPCRSFSPCNLPLQVLEVEFSSGERFTYPAEYLRVHSPAAEARDLAGRPKVRLAGWMQGLGRRGDGGSQEICSSYSRLHWHLHAQCTPCWPACPAPPVVPLP